MGKKFFIHIAATLVIGLALATIYYFAICRGLRETKEFFPGRLNTILYDTARYDAVFMGTSRVSNEIDPLIFDSVTGLHSYNAGMEGAAYTAIDIFTRRFVANHHPRYIFFNIDIYTMENENSLYDFPQYYPHLQDTDIAILAGRKHELAYGKFAPFIAVSYIDDYLKGVALDDWLHIAPADDQTNQHRGFSPTPSSEYHGVSADFPLSFSFDAANFRKLDSLCSYCVSRKCKVIFIMAPIYRAHESAKTNSAAFYKYLKMIEYKYRIKELNFYTDPGFEKTMFANSTHLNHFGANIYTRLLADSFLSGMQ